MACATTIPTPKSAAETSIDGGDSSSLLTLHPDMIQTHILSRLNGPALASAAATCSQLYALASHEDLWDNLCRSTWPSTSSPRVRYFISRFPQGSRSFFSDSCTVARPTPTPRGKRHINLERTPKLISAVDLYYYRGEAILSTVVETETLSEGFRGRRFWVNIVGPKEVVETRMRCPEDWKECWEMEKKLRVSWIVIDASGRRAMNLSGGDSAPVILRQNWPRREVDVWFNWEIDLGGKSVWCYVRVRCVEVEEGGKKMEVREGWLEMVGVNGRESLVLLQRALEGERVSRKKRCQQMLMIRREGCFEWVCNNLWDWFLCLLGR